jgi:hypothetical protein
MRYLLLLGIETEGELDKSPFLGVLFEGFLAAEIVKAKVNAGRRLELYYFRDQQGLEVDFIVPVRGGGGASGVSQGLGHRDTRMNALIQGLAVARRWRASSTERDPVGRTPSPVEKRSGGGYPRVTRHHESALANTTTL